MICSSVEQVYIICIFCSEHLFSVHEKCLDMPKADPPESLRAPLREQGYSDDMVIELWKWYDFSEKKGVASF